ncbi:MAG: hypothetical protein LBU32_16215 [Clostridiales bacterium]|nr:hypothetical protein [Clostridiales bacterium]
MRLQVLFDQPKLPLGELRRPRIYRRSVAPAPACGPCGLRLDGALTGGDGAASMQSLGTALAKGRQLRQI